MWRIWKNPSCEEQSDAELWTFVEVWWCWGCSSNGWELWFTALYWDLLLMLFLMMLWCRCDKQETSDQCLEKIAPESEPQQMIILTFYWSDVLCIDEFYELSTKQVSEGQNCIFPFLNCSIVKWWTFTNWLILLSYNQNYNWLSLHHVINKVFGGMKLFTFTLWVFVYKFRGRDSQMEVNVNSTHDNDAKIISIIIQSIDHSRFKMLFLT